jgi:uncharacterized membrane protein
MRARCRLRRGRERQARVIWRIRVSTGGHFMWARIGSVEGARRSRAVRCAVPLGAALVGLYSMRYALPTSPGTLGELQNISLHPRELSIHAVAASIALMIGPWQMWASLRATRPRLHRWLGRIYVADVLVAWLVSLGLLPHTAAGFGSASAFFAAGVLWVGFTILGVVAIRRREIAAHHRWMLRSYAMAWTAVTVRFYYWPAMALEIPFAYKYPASLWLAVLTNLLVVEILLRQSGLQTAKIAHTASV